MGSVRDLFEKLWGGQITSDDHHPFAGSGELEDIAPRSVFCYSFSNVTGFETDDGLVLVDTGGYFNQRQTYETLRRWSSDRLHTAVFTHGHVDHVFGVPPFAEEAREKGWPQPRVVGHEAMPARFRRYVLTAGWNGVINMRQFGADLAGGRGGARTRLPRALAWPIEYTYPDLTYSTAVTLVVGGEHFELHHARGETDDHTWVWAPERGVLCPGDLFIWAVPNAGNPQKVQRYPQEWARALRSMAELPAEVLAPGHGVIVAGREPVRQALTDTAELLESLHDQTVALMNEGAALDRIIHTVKPPAHLEGRPYLQPVYDEPQYIVRNVWRLYGGWYDGIPSHLSPAPESQQGSEVARLAGGVQVMLDRARELAQEGDRRMACHLLDWALAAEPDSREVHQACAEIYGQRADESRATMTRGVFRYAQWESEEFLEGGRPS